MAIQTVRPTVRDPREPVDHALDPLRIAGQLVHLCLTIRRADDGAWRGRLRFIDDSRIERETAEIFCAATEEDLWRSVRELREHHVRDLYRSLD
ncbi:MAG TPA: hypothetical protein VFW66_00505 [Gemmatimonadales bacterium]|nr:hypothetical protein [Gemmatimonadales bacterium]